MSSTLGMFCAHKRLRSACPTCTPEVQARVGVVEDDDPYGVRPRKTLRAAQARR